MIIERIKHALHQSDDVSLRLKTNDIPTCDSILRAVSVSSGINTEDTLNDFITEHILSALRLTVTQRERLRLNVF